MVNRLKEILLTMAQLPGADQQWILQQLPIKALETFKAKQGLTLLQQARRFRSLKTNKLAIPFEKSSLSLPDYCQQLATKSPLYVAIILEQGNYPWTANFLKQFDNHKLISTALENHTPDIKFTIKQALFNEWNSLYSFERYLDDQHG